MTARVLFLDDEPMVLEALRDIVYPQRGFYQPTFVTSAAEALERLDSVDFDVIVMDLCLEDADGAELLGELRKRFPDVVRIVLTANTDQQIALRTATAAHQVLSKPCDGRLLKQVIERSLLLRALLTDSVIRSTVGGIDSLPSIPRVYLELTRAIQSPSIDAAAIAQIVEQDMALCAKLLQLANSGFFGLRRVIDTVDDAVRYLGLEMVRSLALSAGAFRVGPSSGFSVEALQEHALRVCRTVKTLPEAPSQRGDLLVAAMLHDIGKLVLAARLPGHLERALERARAEGIALHEAEYAESGISHAEIGGYLLGIWGLPCAIVEAVAYHHDPGKIPHQKYELVDAIHVANLLVNEEQEPDRAAVSRRALSLSHLVEPPLSDLGDFRRYSEEQERPAS